MLHSNVQTAVDELFPWKDKDGNEYLFPTPLPSSWTVEGIHLNTFLSSNVKRHLTRNTSYLDDLRYYWKTYMVATGDHVELALLRLIALEEKKI